MFSFPRTPPAAFVPGLSGSYYTVPGWRAITFSTTGAALVAGDLVYFPIRIDRTVLFDRAGFYVASSGGSGTLIRVGVYSDAGGLPGQLVADWGTVSADLTSSSSEATISWSPAPGFYWLCYVSNGNPTCGQNHASTGGDPPCNANLLATISSANTNAINGYLVVGSQLALVAGGLPAQAVAPVSKQNLGYLKLRCTI